MADIAGGGASSGDVVYGWSLWRAAAATAVIGFGAAAIGGSVPSLLRGDVPYADTGEVLTFVIIYGLVFTAGSVLFDRQRPSRVRFTAEGVELSGARRDGVFVPWSVAPSARVRWVWPVTTLEVTAPAVDAPRVMRLHRGGRAPSLRRRRNGTLRFSMPLYGLAASSKSVQAEFLRRSRH